MVSQAGKHGVWSEFPIELWRKVMVLVYKRLMTCFSGRDYADHVSAQHCLPKLYQLKLVCKNLHSAFLQEPLLKRDMVIPIKGCSLDELILWAEEHCDAIENVVAQVRQPALLAASSSYSNPFTELVLVALYVKRARLLSAHIAGTSDLTMQMLAKFDCLRECHFRGSKSRSEKALPLNALQSLPSLSKIVLTSGSFTHLDAAEHLTCLRLDRAYCLCTDDCAFVTSLKNMTINNSELKNFHQDGLAACSALQRLALDCASITVRLTNDDEDQEQQLVECDVFTAMSALTQLTTLCLAGHDDGRELQCDWLAQLRGLHFLAIRYDTYWLHLPEGISALGKLRELRLSTGTQGQVFCNFDWAFLKSLETVCLNGHIQCSSGLDALASLRMIERIDLVSCLLVMLRNKRKHLSSEVNSALKDLRSISGRQRL